MLRYLCLTFLFSTSLAAAAQSRYQAQDLNISFYSQTPLKEFKAYSTTGTAAFDPATKEISFSVDISSFTFYRLLMQEHFNKKYMESDRYPAATFRGTVTSNVDLSKKGAQAVTVSGTLEIHGKKQKREIEGTFKANPDANTILMTAAFEVKPADHGISIPSSLTEQIAGNIRVKVRGEFAPYDQLVKK